MSLSWIQQGIITHVGVLAQQGTVATDWKIADLMSEDPGLILEEFRKLSKRDLLDISAETHTDGCPTVLTETGWNVFRSLSPSPKMP